MRINKIILTELNSQNKALAHKLSIIPSLIGNWEYMDGTSEARKWLKYTIFLICSSFSRAPTNMYERIENMESSRKDRMVDKYVNMNGKLFSSWKVFLFAIKSIQKLKKKNIYPNDYFWSPCAYVQHNRLNDKETIRIVF